MPATGWNEAHPISADITAVGVFHARSINVPENAEIVASQGNTVYGATVQLDAGRIFMFGDEWVSYTSQWTGEGVSNDCNNDPNHSCYGTSPGDTYQVPQFWYNAILWASGDVECFNTQEEEDKFLY